MKTLSLVVTVAALSGLVVARGQGTFTYDQQSQTNEFLPALGTGTAVQDSTAPWGQSFTPALSEVGFIRLMLDDGNGFDGLGATMYVNLISGSIGGSVIGTSSSVTMPPFFAGVTDFVFPVPIGVTPGVTYFFTPVVTSGGTWNIISGGYGYAGGSAFNGGVAEAASDLWFREGIIVPEPSSGALLGFLVCWAAAANRRAHRCRRG